MTHRGLKDSGYGWAYGGLVQFEWGDFIVQFDSFEQRTRVLTDSIGMRSPFTDIGGSRIYQGDILKDLEGRVTAEVRFSEFVVMTDHQHELSYEVTGWHVRFCDDSTHPLTQNGNGYSVKAAYCSIIGNIFENKDLIPKK
jgi:uncharacterized phage protein (TIGR01671 family)